MFKKYDYKVLLRCMYDKACVSKPQGKAMNIKEWTDFMGALGFTAVGGTFAVATVSAMAVTTTVLVAAAKLSILLSDHAFLSRPPVLCLPLPRVAGW